MDFFYENVSPRDMFIHLVNDKPSTTMKDGVRWHLGNVGSFDEDNGYFAIGKTTKSTIQKYDDVAGNFIEEDFESSPYAYCIFNVHIGFLGIPKKLSLSSSFSGIAKKIKLLFSKN